MSELRINVHNYGLAPNAEYNMESGTIFFFRGMNNSGKTTMLNLVRSVMEVKDGKTDIVRHGETEGQAFGSIPGADGLQYQFRYDYDKEGNQKFKFIRPNGTTIKTIGEMRAIFGYNHITVSDWMDMSKTEPGRKKQREQFISMLSEQDKEQLKDIEAKINGKDGTLFTKRTNAKAMVATLEEQGKKHVHTPEDQAILSGGNKIKPLLDSLKADKEKLEKVVNESAVNMEKLSNARKGKQSLMDDNEAFNVTIDEEIAELERKLEAKRKSKADTNKACSETITKYDKDITELEKQVDEKTITEAKVALSGDPEGKTKEEVHGVTMRLEKGQEIQTRYVALLAKNEEWVKSEKELQAKRKEVENLNTEIDELREKKKTIIKNSKDIPDRWGIEDDGVTYDGQPFTMEDISLSKATRAIAELMIHVNKAPVMIMGDAECLGYPILRELNEIAKEFDRIMIFAEHDRTIDDIELVCYDMMGIPDGPVDVKPSNNLF